MTPLDLGRPDPSSPAATDPARVWQQWLDQRGLLLALGTQPDDPASPVGLVHRIQANLASLVRAETALEDARKKNPLARIELPPLVWAVVGVLLLAIILAAEAVVALLGAWAIWAGLALSVAVATWTLLERKLVDPQVRVRLRQAQETLRSAVDELDARSFVARLDRRLLVHTPHLTQLQALAEGLRAAAAPSSVLPALEDEVARLQATLEQHLSDPPTRWTEAGLVVDVEDWQARVDED